MFQKQVNPLIFNGKGEVSPRIKGDRLLTKYSILYNDDLNKRIRSGKLWECNVSKVSPLRQDLVGLWYVAAKPGRSDLSKRLHAILVEWCEMKNAEIRQQRILAGA